MLPVSLRRVTAPGVTSSAAPPELAQPAIYPEGTYADSAHP